MKTNVPHAGTWAVRPGSLLLLLLLVGCANSSSQPAPTRNTGSAPSGPAPTVSAGPVPLQTAWGQVSIHRLPSAMSDNHVFVFDNAATSDGQWLVGAIEPRDFITNTTRPSFAVLYNITTRQIVTMHQLLTPQSQILAAAADDHWVVWTEADDQPNFFNWTLFAYNQQTRQVRQLAQATKINGQAVSGPYPTVVLDHGLLIWNQAVGPVSPATLDNAVVRTENLATGTVTTLATRAGAPLALSWPWVAWSQVTTGSGGYTLLKNLNTGQELHITIQSSYITLAGTSVAYTDIQGYRLYLLSDVTQSTTNPQILVQVEDAGDHIQYITMNDRLIAWAQYTAIQVWDRAEHRLVTLPISNGESDSWVGGHTLVWLDPEPKAQQDQDLRENLIPTPTFDVIDTANLPVLP